MNCGVLLIAKPIGSATHSTLLRCSFLKQLRHSCGVAPRIELCVALRSLDSCLTSHYIPICCISSRVGDYYE